MSCLERLCGPPRRLLHGRLQGQARGPAAPGRAACANVLTPDRIPEFCIPPRLAPGRALAALGDPRGGGGGGRTDAGAGRTDWDPRSQAALSLPHLPRARTAYGFCALLESPHTRRKESLLLGRAPGGLLSRALRAPGSRGPARARPVSRGDGDGDEDGDEGEERGAGPAPPPPPRSPRPGRPQAGGTVTPGRAEHRRPGGRLRIRLRGAEGLPGRGRSVLQPPGPRGCEAASERGRGRGQGELPVRGALRCSGGA